MLNSARFADCTPYTTWARLLDEGPYLASVRTFYRVHFGRSRAIDDQRRRVLQATYAARPERFKGRLPMPPALPTVVGINLPQPETKEATHDLATTPMLLTNIHHEVSQSH